MIVAEIFDGPWIDGFIPDQALDAEVTVQLYARNAIAPVRWEVLTDPGELPADFAIDAATGVVTFTADEAGAFSVSIRVTDSEPCQTSSTFTWRVEMLPLEVTGTIPDMTVGTPVTGTLTMSGGVEPRSLSGYTLPAGVTLTKTNETTLTFGGTPTGAGLGPGTSFAFDASVDIADSASGSAVLSDSITLTVTAVVAAFDPTPLLDATVGTPYTAQVDASNGVPPYTYAVTTGALPAGVSLNDSTGEITGTPTTAATGVSFTVTVTDDEGNTDDVADTVNVLESIDYPLDAYTTGLYGAWSTRKLLTGYAGSCIRLLDSQDNSETDIGFSAGEVNWSAIAAIIAATYIGRAHTIYDQSGNGNHWDNPHAPTTGVPDVWRDGASLDGFDFLNSGTRAMQTPASSGAYPVIVVCVNFVSRGFVTLGADVLLELGAPFNASGKNGILLYGETTAGNRPVIGISQGATNYILSTYTGGSNFTSGVVTLIYDRNASGADKVKFRLNGTLQTRGGNYDSGTVTSGDHSAGERFYLGARGPITSPTLPSIFKKTSMAIWQLSTAPDSTWLAGVEQSIGHTL